MPTVPQMAPMPVDRRVILLKLLVSNRAITGGITTAAAIIITPNTCMETTMVLANISENRVSTQPVGTP